MKVSVGVPSTVAKRLARHFTSGRSRVLTPVPPDKVWVFFQRFPHTITSWHVSYHRYGECWVSTYHLPSAPILTVPIPNLPFNVAEKALESLSSPPPFGGNERCILSGCCNPGRFHLNLDLYIICKCEIKSVS
jgi:hypothetical protein